MYQYYEMDTNCFRDQLENGKDMNGRRFPLQREGQSLLRAFRQSPENNPRMYYMKRKKAFESHTVITF